VSVPYQYRPFSAADVWTVLYQTRDDICVSDTARTALILNWHVTDVWTELYSAFPWIVTALHLSPPHEVRESCDRDAHSHTFDPKLGASTLTQHSAGLGVKVLFRKCACSLFKRCQQAYHVSPLDQGLCTRYTSQNRILFILKLSENCVDCILHLLLQSITNSTFGPRRTAIISTNSIKQFYLRNGHALFSSRYGLDV
jgi:hypothetical protein